MASLTQSTSIINSNKRCYLCEPEGGRKFRKQWKLWQHQREFHGIKAPYRFNCTFCPGLAGWDSKGPWREHLLTIHSIQEPEPHMNGMPTRTKLPPPTPLMAMDIQLESTAHPTALPNPEPDACNFEPEAPSPAPLVTDPVPTRSYSRTPVSSGQLRPPTSQYEYKPPSHPSHRRDLIRRKYHQPIPYHRPAEVTTRPVPTNANINSSASASSSFDIPLFPPNQAASSPWHLNVTLHLGLSLTINPETGEVTAIFREADMDPITSAPSMPEAWLFLYT